MRVILKPLGVIAILVLLGAMFTAGLTLRQRKSQAPGVVLPPGAIVRMDAGGAVATQDVTSSGASVQLDPRSPVNNGSFEEKVGKQSPAGWAIDMAGGNAVQCSYVEGHGGDAHSGDLHGTHYGGSTYNIRTTQVLTGLKDGLYTLRAWTKKNPGKENASYLVAKDYAPGQPKKQAPIPVGEKEWQQVEVRDIPVQGGQCTIGIFSQAQGGRWTQFDDVEFIPQN